MNSVIAQKFYLHNPIGSADRDVIEKARTELFSEVDTGYPLYLSSETDQDIVKIKDVAEKIRNEFRNLVIIATGASNTIPHSVAALSAGYGVNIYYLDNADHVSFEKIMGNLDPSRTAFLSISKSGETIEIIALTLLCIEWVSKNIGATKLATNFFAITEQGDNTLRKITNSFQATILDHPKAIGGRFAVFSSVGLLIAAIVGFDIDKIIISAKEAFSEQIKSNSWVCEGASYMLAMSRQYSNSVFMIYGDQLNGIANWYRQLIAESLGKQSKGLTPIIAAGLIDQHSQLQLYLDGPNDKFFTFLTKNCKDQELIPISTDIKECDLEYLQGKTLTNIMQAQLSNVTGLLQQHKKNIRIINATALDEQFIGEFMMGQMLEIMLFAFSQNINPFGQPAVEKIKDTMKSILNQQKN